MLGTDIDKLKKWIEQDEARWENLLSLVGESGIDTSQLRRALVDERHCRVSQHFTSQCMLQDTT